LRVAGEGVERQETKTKQAGNESHCRGAMETMGVGKKTPREKKRKV